MTENEKNELYKLFIEKWGADSQILMCIEEMSELTKELCKLYRPDIMDKTKILENVKEELADVLNMCDQLKYMYGKEEVEKIQEQKLIRTKKFADKE